MSDTAGAAISTSLGGGFRKTGNRRARNTEAKKDVKSMKAPKKGTALPGEVPRLILQSQWDTADQHKDDYAWLEKNADVGNSHCGLDFTQIKRTNKNLLYAVKFAFLLETVRNVREAQGITTDVLDFSDLLESPGTVGQHVLKPRLNMLTIATKQFPFLTSFAVDLKELSKHLDKGWFKPEAPPTAMSSFADLATMIVI